MRDPGTDPLSPLAKKIIDAAPYDALVVAGGGGKASLSHELLDRVTPDQLFAVPVKDHVAASAVLAALWLWHGKLNACHEVVQKEPEQLLSVAMNRHFQGSRASLNVISGAEVELDALRDPVSMRKSAETLAFWHAMMHRREADFSNAKYWYARCADHPILPSLNAQASAVLNPLPADKSILRLTAHGWNPAAFVDFVEQLHDQPSDPRHPLAVSLQRMEWRVLFDYCTRAAAGS